MGSCCFATKLYICRDFEYQFVCSCTCIQFVSIFLYFQIIIMDDILDNDVEPDERMAHEAFVRADIDARRRAAGERRLERLAGEFRLEEESVPAITGADRLLCVQSISFNFLPNALMCADNNLISVTDHNEAFPMLLTMSRDDLEGFRTKICRAITVIDDLLPDLAGRLEIEIAANVDTAISTDKVLRVVLATTRATSAVYSAAATLGHYLEMCPGGRRRNICWLGSPSRLFTTTS